MAYATNNISKLQALNEAGSGKSSSQTRKIIPTSKMAGTKKPAKRRFNILFHWSGKRDSNSRPQPWQGCALPTELFPRTVETPAIVAPHTFLSSIYLIILLFFIIMLSTQDRPGCTQVNDH